MGYLSYRDGNDVGPREVQVHTTRTFRGPSNVILILVELSSVTTPRDASTTTKYSESACLLAIVIVLSPLDRLEITYISLMLQSRAYSLYSNNSSVFSSCSIKLPALQRVKDNDFL